MERSREGIEMMERLRKGREEQRGKEKGGKIERLRQKDGERKGGGGGEMHGYTSVTQLF